MSRSRKKAYFTDHNLLSKVQKFNQSKAEGVPKPIRTHSRRSTITPEFAGVTLLVHNGKNFVVVNVTDEMIDHKLGEFAATRKFTKHPDKKVGKK